VGVACLAGCGGGSSKPPVDASDPGPKWWQPKIGEVKNWDIQLTAPFDVSAPRVMYDLDLWAVVPSPTMLDYGAGEPVMVPAGKLAGTIAQLHARTPSTIVICHIDTGALDLSLPDAPKFPGYMADPTKIPDNPDSPAPGTVKGDPAAGSVIGWSLGIAGKRLLDLRAASRAQWMPIMLKRFDLAKSIGCDGIEPAYNDGAAYSSGFMIPTEDSYSWYAEVATQGHDRLLSTGMKNGDTINAVNEVQAPNFDWLMLERCGELLTCDTARPFVSLEKAVLALEYNTNSDTGAAQDPAAVCMNQKPFIMDGLVKNVALTSQVRTQCP